jgi:glycosyltransferase involved in cell wall biosynthesis
VDSDVVAKRLGKLAAALGVADRLTITGHVADDELPALLRSAHLMVSAARHDPAGRAVIAAMACGVPIVATSVGAPADAVIDGTTGLLLPPGRPEVLARRVRDLMASPLKLSAYGIASADRARSRYPWQRIAAETVAAYQRCLPASASPVLAEQLSARKAA